MPKTSDAPKSSLVDQLKTTLHDTVDYAASALHLLQARMAELALSSLVFVALMAAASLLVIAAFIVLNVAFGVWLAHLWGSALVALLVLGGFYAVLAVIAGASAFRWLKRLKS